MAGSRVARLARDDSHEKINCFKTLRALFRGERFVHREKCLEMLQKLFRTWVSSFRLMKADGINKDGDQKMGNG